jgi:prepilin peptidase CpaA
MNWDTISKDLVENWHFWFVTATLIVAAWIDGKQLKVPNWLTFPMVASGWVFCMCTHPEGVWAGLLYSLIGTVVGLAVLMPPYMIGGMGAGDVKLMAGIGAWVGGADTLYAFCWSAVVGGVLAVLMVMAAKAWAKHQRQFFMILHEIFNVGNPETLATIAAERKPRMFLLPYGIPMAIGTIMYFAWEGKLLTL